MIRRANAKLIVVVVLSGACLIGGPTHPAFAQEAGGSLTSAPETFLHHSVSFTGQVPGATAGQQIVVERQQAAGGAWLPTTTATATDGGAFTASWAANRLGHFSVRAVLGSSDPDTAQAASATQTTSLTVYRPSVATWFGPGFYGKRTACGETLSRTILGVAHTSLPCGTLVDFYYKGKTISVPVVDRGPYAKGVSWDLTYATSQALGFDSRGTVGAVAERGTDVAPTDSTDAPPPASAASSASGGAQFGG